MSLALDAVVEVFTWIGLGGAVVIAIALVAVWAFDGTWLPADAIVDHEADGTWVRWFDGDGEANSARADDHLAAELAGRDRSPIWYRHGWQGRMRLTRRPPASRPLAIALGSLLALSAVSFAVSMISYVVRG